MSSRVHDVEVKVNEQQYGRLKPVEVPWMVSPSTPFLEAVSFENPDGNFSNE